MKDFREQILRVKVDEQIPIILVGNKVDMKEERVVGAEEAKSLAHSWGVQYDETSAKMKVNVDKVYYDLVIQIKERKDAASGTQHKKKKKSKCTIL